MENIAKFLQGCEKLGCPKHDLFQTIDLYENKNPGQVVDAIFSLSRHAAKAGCDIPVCPCFAQSAVRIIVFCLQSPF